MATKKTATIITSKASKTLSIGVVGKSSKLTAGSTLLQVGTSKGAKNAIKSVAGQILRTVKPAPKVGSISRAAAKKAVLAVINSRKK